MIGHRTRMLLLGVAGWVLVPTPSEATMQASSLDKPFWRYDPPGDITLYQQDPLGNILLGTNETTVSIDLGTGEPRWQRDDLKDLGGWWFEIVPMTTIGVSWRANRLLALDVGDGKTLWDETALPFESIRGYMTVPAHAMLLVYGKTAQSDNTLLALDLATGATIWRNDDLFDKAPPLECYQRSTKQIASCPTIRTSWIQILYGHQKPLADSDTSLVLYISEDGPVRLHAWTGKVLWRGTVLKGKELPRPSREFASWLARDGVLYVPSERKLIALDLASGATTWHRNDEFRAPVTQMAFTGPGLVVRGHRRSDDGTPKDFFLDLVDPATGTSVWKGAYRDLYNTRSFQVLDDHALLLHGQEVHRVDLRNGRAERLEFKLREGVTADYLQVIDGGLVVTAPQQVLRMGTNGVQPYHVYYEPPKYAWWQNALGSALSAAISVAAVHVMESMRDYDPREFTWTDAQGRPTGAPGGDRLQQYATVYRTIYEPKIQDRMTATMNGVNYAYINTGERDGQRTGFNLVRIDKRDGSVAGRLFLGEREPAYRVDPASGIILLRDAGAIAAYRYPSP